MKKRLLYTMVILFAATHFSDAQEKMDKYCTVTIKWVWSRRISIDAGTPGLYFKDSVLVKDLQQIKADITETDVLDHMSRLGWSFVSSYSLYRGGGLVMYFKKPFDKDQFLQGNSYQ